jgi:hypothetical protein
VFSASSNSNHTPGGRSGGFFGGIGDSIINADNAMNRMLNSRMLSSVGQTFNKIGFGLPLVHLAADSLGYAAFKGIEGLGRMLGGKGSVDYHFEKEWGAGKSASACKPSSACGTAAGNWSHTRGQFDMATHGPAHASSSGAVHDAWRSAACREFDATRCGALAREGFYRHTTHTQLSAYGSLVQITTTSHR